MQVLINFRLDFQERLLPMENPYFSKEVNDFSPRIALTKKISEGLFLYTNVSKGFAPPPRGAIDNNGTQLNFNLESTKGWNKELGIRGNTFSGQFFYDIALYKLDVKDVILPRVSSNLQGIELLLTKMPEL